MSQQDEFTYDKGLKDDYEGVITDAWFGVPENAQGRVHLYLKKLADDGEEVEDRYPVGTDWASFDGGKTVEHPSKTKLRDDSGAATLTTKAFECGAEDVLRERSAALDHSGPKAAALWPGLKFHWYVDEKPYKVKDRETGEMSEGVSRRSYPDRFVGVVDGAVGGSASGANPSTTSSTGGDNSTASADPLDGVDPAIAAKLKILAQTKPYSDWVDECLALTEVRDNAILLSALGDEGFYNKLKG